MNKTEKILCTVLREASSPWEAGLASSDVDLFIESARLNGVLPLLTTKLSDDNFANRSDEILIACREAGRDQAVYELAHRAELNKVLEALYSTGIRPLILKGTALAYNLYSNPALRPRGDSDLLIHPDWFNETGIALKRMGYTKRKGGEGKYIFHQATWYRQDSLGMTHNLDVHWRTSNSEVLAKLLTHDELAARSTALKALGPHARALGHTHALLFACIHRAGHAHSPMYFQGVAHEAMNRLIWLYDIHLLITAMSVEELNEFATLASEKRIKEICRDALLRTRECFSTKIPQPILDKLINAGPTEPSALFLSAGRLRLMVENFRALGGWRARMGWTWQLAFPSANYMRWKYANATATPLLILYVRRGLNGIVQLIRQGSGRRND